LTVVDQSEEDINNAVSVAFSNLVQAHGLTLADVARALEVPESNVRRMTKGQAMTIAFVTKFEDWLRIPRGTLFVHAGVVYALDTPEALLATDIRLHPVYRRSAVEMVESWVKLSKEFEEETRSIS
jgi:transcriptional regulator with XRE-family HTH domain